MKLANTETRTTRNISVGNPYERSPASCAEVKDAWSCNFTFPYIFMMWCLIKDKDNKIFTFYPYENKPKKDQKGDIILNLILFK
jgi:hypothetical protein